MFSIENSETRKSLKSVFENIFAKYGREFDEDDEVDLMSLQVTRPGGHLARLKPVHFGAAFKRKPPPNPQEELNDTTIYDDLDEIFHRVIGGDYNQL